MSSIGMFIAALITHILYVGKFPTHWFNYDEVDELSIAKEIYGFYLIGKHTFHIIVVLAVILYIFTYIAKK